VQVKPAGVGLLQHELNRDVAAELLLQVVPEPLEDEGRRRRLRERLGLDVGPEVDRDRHRGAEARDSRLEPLHAGLVTERIPGRRPGLLGGLDLEGGREPTGRRLRPGLRVRNLVLAARLFAEEVLQGIGQPEGGDVRQDLRVGVDGGGEGREGGGGIPY